MEKLWMFVKSHLALAKYAAKVLFESREISKKTILYTICSIVIFIILMSVLLPLLLIFYIYKNIVSLILYHKIGSKFISLITGCNLMSSLTDKKGAVISSIFYIESDRVCEELFKEIREKIWKNFKSPTADRKFFSVRKEFMSYLYFEEFKNVDKSKLFDYAKLDVGEDLNDVIQNYCTVKSLPYGGNFNWDFVLLSLPELSENGKKKYIMIFRMHHFLVDGSTMVNLSKIISKPSEEWENYGKYISRKHLSKPKPKTPTTLKNFCAFPSALGTSNSPSPKLNSSFSLYIESQKSAIPKLKEIKEIFPDISFNHLILTAYSASVANYFLLNTPKNMPVPEILNITSPMQFDAKKIPALFCGPPSLHKLNNDFTIYSFDMPILPRNKKGVPIENYMIERMKIIKDEILNIINSMDFVMNYVLITTYFEVFPLCVTELIMNSLQFHGAATIFPGGSKRSLFNGDLITDCAFVITLLERIKICLYGFTYDDRLQFTQVADPNLFESKEEFDKILPNIFKYLDILYEESKKYKK